MNRGDLIAQMIEAAAIEATIGITDGHTDLRQMQRIRAAAFTLAAWADKHIGNQGGQMYSEQVDPPEAPVHYGPGEAMSWQVGWINGYAEAWKRAFEAGRNAGYAERAGTEPERW